MDIHRKNHLQVGHTVEICGHNMTRILMLAVLGNFVSTPADPKYGSQSSVDTLATVVVDYTGSLVVVHLFATMRTYFLESLLHNWREKIHYISSCELLSACSHSLVPRISCRVPAFSG